MPHTCKQPCNACRSPQLQIPHTCQKRQSQSSSRKSSSRKSRSGSSSSRKSRSGSSSSRKSRSGSSSSRKSRSGSSSSRKSQSRHHVAGLPGLHGEPIKCTDPKNDSVIYAKKDDKTDSTCTGGLPGSSINRIFPKPVSGNLNWEKRSKQIVQQIKKRGLDPLQFGAIPADAIVSDEFSWRGYTRMLCMRLNATTDPGLAVTVGCPKEDWEGWRI
jgi:hypothetical protein